MPRRYPAGGSYRGQYSYQQEPTAQQYESFFNPIPIEFLQQQFDRRQGAYDTAFAGSIAAKEQMAAQQVGMRDIGSKNQIITDTMSNIDKTVEEKYGGDWGRASKEIASMVSSARQNPFWNAQAEVQKKRDAYQGQIDKFGAQGMQFGVDPRQLSTLDESGRVRSADQFTGRVVEQGDWGKTARDIFSTLTPDKIQLAGLSELEKGYLAAGELTRITPEKLQKLASDPDVQRAFQQSHPEFVEAYQSGTDAQKEKFGVKGESLAEVTERTLYGNIAPAAFQQRERQILYDKQSAAARLKEKIQAQSFGPVREHEATPTGYGTDEQKGKQQLRWNFNIEGDLLPGAGEIDKITYDQVSSTVNRLRKENPSLTKGMTDYDLYKDYLDDPTGDKYTFTMDQSAPILNEEVTVNMGRSIANNVDGTAFYLEGGTEVTNNWDENGGLGEETGIPMETMTTMLQNDEIPMGYNITKGSYYVEVPIIDGGITKSADGSVNWTKTSTDGKVRVYFSPDEATKGIANFMRNADQAIKDPAKRDELLAALPQTVRFNEEAYDEGGDVNTQELFIMLDEDGNEESYSLNELRGEYYRWNNSYSSAAYSDVRYKSK